ncbi:Phenylacetic acid catabolic protein [Martelella limonii]|uniref:Phenylacetic acid catabolic protein n=1 Tax=Martelella limonii TaxID=1647649 RepID=UPI001580B7F7|nr:Phenylacetic acid catabolic protein [Martelella limonii]
MTSDMSITDYLAEGGKLSSPDNAPALYRAELMRMMSSFVDSELAGSAGFAAAINWAPGISERIAASRIVLEKADHAERVLALMADFGTDVALYNRAHSWSSRLSRDQLVDPRRMGGDMRLSVFHYPLEDWMDAVVMNVLMGIATVIQLEEMSGASYAPYAEVIRAVLPRERRHMELGVEGLNALCDNDEARADVLADVAYWYPRVAETFGPAVSDRFARLQRFGLRHTENEVLRTRWREAAKRVLDECGLQAPH